MSPFRTRCISWALACCLLSCLVGVITLYAPKADETSASDSVSVPDGAELKSFAFKAMGTQFTVRYYHDWKDSDDAKSLVQDVIDQVADLERTISARDAQSELSRLNDAAMSQLRVRISPQMAVSLSFALQAASSADGAFDPTVAPLVRLWHLARRTGKLPTAEQIAEAKSLVGYNLVQVIYEDSSEEFYVQYYKLGIQFDLGGIGKGMAVDLIASTLFFANKIKQYCISSTSDVLVGDPPPNRKTWRVGLHQAGVPERDWKQIELPPNHAVSTSGMTHQYLTIDGVLYSHVVDVRTGLGSTNPQTCTVIVENSAALADALATGVSQMREEKVDSCLKPFNARRVELKQFTIENGR